MPVTYATEKTMVIRSPLLVTIRFIFFLLIGAYIVWLLFFRAGYQQIYYGTGFTSIKTKGVAFENETQSGVPIIWDRHDTVYPQSEQEAVFITATTIKTGPQTRSICPEQQSCTKNEDCAVLNSSQGYNLNNCTNGSCQVAAWCPLESSSTKPLRLQNLERMRVAVKSFVKLGEGDETSRYTAKIDVRVSDILNNASVPLETLYQNGTVVALMISWDCDFDFGKKKPCEGHFSYTRMDFTDSDSSGYNFRHALQYKVPGQDVTYRELTKVYGLRLLIITDARYRKFEFFSFFLQCASAFGLLAVAGYLTDVVAMWFLPDSVEYRNQKFMNIDAQEIEVRRQKWTGVLSDEELNKAYF
ncbi:P2X purinoceptor 4-like [Planoprotostelium fungivorum]|uniref:P2X purinoceptor 4-like n=1 Tax=Planoprotostelium fungivorum TaxID=1890364 RepID=A0A2P6NNC7_9EUKA|nr:P2X purinoceptor 4-like [Planoprotostelium fungivorum]